MNKTCPGCGIELPDDEVYICSKCGHIYCFSCMSDKSDIMELKYICPKCGSDQYRWSVIGVVKKDTFVYKKPQFSECFRDFLQRPSSIYLKSNINTSIVLDSIKKIANQEDVNIIEINSSIFEMEDTNFAYIYDCIVGVEKCIILIVFDSHEKEYPSLSKYYWMLEKEFLSGTKNKTRHINLVLLVGKNTKVLFDPHFASRLFNTFVINKETEI